MIDVALLSIIRRWHLRDHVSLREIAKRLGISRNTVRRYLRSGTIEPTYSRAAGPTVLDVFTTMLYTHVLKVGGAGVRSPLEALPPLSSER